jgi:hypothetical protein
LLDFPASGQVLWSLYDAGGPRPEYVLPPLYLESGFNPAIPNQAGYPYYGLNQVSGSRLASMGIDVQDYLTWPASRQLSTIVAPMFLEAVRQFGPLRSATRVYQANFLPATLTKEKSLDSVLAHRGNTNEWSAGDVYGANSSLDWSGRGTITVGDLAHFMTQKSVTPAVKSAIAETYALRPGETPHDPALGEDFGTQLLPQLQFKPTPLLVAAMAGGLAWGLYSGALERGWRQVRRWLPV